MAISGRRMFMPSSSDVEAGTVEQKPQQDVQKPVDGANESNTDTALQKEQTALKTAPAKGKSAKAKVAAARRKTRALTQADIIEQNRYPDDKTTGVKGVSHDLLYMAKGVIKEQGGAEGNVANVDIINIALLSLFLRAEGDGAVVPKNTPPRIARLAKAVNATFTQNSMLEQIKSQLVRINTELTQINSVTRSTELMTATNCATMLDVTGPEWRTPNSASKVMFEDVGIGDVIRHSRKSVTMNDHREHVRNNPNSYRG